MLEYLEGVGQEGEGVGQEAEGQGRVSIAYILGRARNLIGSPDSPVSIGEALLKLWQEQLQCCVGIAIHHTLSCLQCCVSNKFILISQSLHKPFTFTGI